MNNIYLVGFMATGKSVVGKALAKKLQSIFIDLDELIEKKAGKNIPSIFRVKGEAYFRKIEKEALRQVSGRNNLVVSCGGGVVTNAQNIKVMKKSGRIICLKASPVVILKRSTKDSNRPLLNVDSPKNRIKELLLKRAVFYSKADYTLDTSRIGVGQVVDKLVQYIQNFND
ncbi:MAG: shikimate kinase [Candidatus Omnitrophota bacterium]